MYILLNMVLIVLLLHLQRNRKPILLDIMPTLEKASGRVFVNAQTDVFTSKISVQNVHIFRFYSR